MLWSPVTHFIIPAVDARAVIKGFDTPKAASAGNARAPRIGAEMLA
jgi:hypothetical protein